MVCEYELVFQVKIFFLVIGVMEEQRVAIKFCVKAGESTVETIELINKAYGSTVMSRVICIGGMIAFETEGGREGRCRKW